MHLSQIRPLTILVLAVLFGAACSGEVNTDASLQTSEATTGQELTERIISLSPSATEILFEIGAGDKVVAVDGFSDFPADAPSDDRLDAFNVDLEVVASYEPTVVVLGVDSPETIEDLEDRSIEVLLLPTADSVADMYSQIEQLGEVANQSDFARQLINDIEISITVAAQSLQEVEGTSIYHEVAAGNSGFFYQHEGTFLGDVYSRLGLTVVGDESSLVDNEISAELIVAAGPDVILVNNNDFSIAPDDLANREGWGSVPAVVNGQIFAVDTDTSSRSGPRIRDYITDLADDLLAVE